MSNKRIVVFHFVGGPCGRKTTLSAGLFFHLKTHGHEAELVPELVKRYIWKSKQTPAKFEMINNQYLMSSKHFKSYHVIVESNEIEAIVLDGSPLNGLWYSRNNMDNTSNLEVTDRMILDKFGAYPDKIRNVVFVLKRDPSATFEKRGRIHNEEQAKLMDDEMQGMLDMHGIDYVLVDATDAETLFQKAEAYLS